MKYIKPIPNPSGAFPPPQSTPAPGLIAISDELAEVVTASRGFVSLAHDESQVREAIPLSDELAQWEAAHPEAVPESGTTSPTQQREEAYNTQPIIEWEGELLTVSQAAQKWMYYAAEDNAKADELTALIAAAKQTIRAQYPDEEVVT